eukprot:554627_1
MHVYSILVGVCLGVIITLVPQYLRKTKKYIVERSLSLVKSFNDYAENYTYTCDKFAVGVVYQDIQKRNAEGGNLCVIGAGPNPTISHLIKYFNKVYLIDPNPYWHEKWKKLDWYANLNIIRINDTFDNIHKYVDKSVRFEWMIASHIFYYIKQQEMDNNIKLIKKYLQQNTGKIIISIAKDNECDIAKLCKYVQPEYKLCANVEEYLNKNDMKYKIIQSTDEGDMNAQNKESLLCIMSMHLNDYVIGNDEYNSIVKMDNNTVRQVVSMWIENHMKMDPDDKNNVIYHQHTAHYIVSA